MTRTQRLSLIGAALVLLLVVAAGAAWMMMRGGQAPGPAAEAERARPSVTVSVAPPQRRELPVSLAANGNVAAWQEAVVGSESNGLRIDEVRVNVGDRVRKGQVLAVFSGDTVRAEVAQARAAVAEARATAADAAATAERARTLEATGALSQQQINQYATAAQTARARVEAAEAALSAQQVRGRNTQVSAPDDGVISSRSATVGSVVAAGTELFRLIRKGRLEWRAEVTAPELGRIQPGTPAVITGPAGSRVEGRVRSIAPTVDPQTRVAIVYVDLPDALKESALKAGMFARGEFQLGRTDAVTVPEASLVPRDGFNYLMLLQPDQHVAQMKVDIGRRVDDRIEITTPLPPDAQVVVQGARFLNDGDLVRVAEATPAAPPPAAPPRTRAP